MVRALLPWMALLSGGCSLLVGDGSFAVGKADAGADVSQGRDAPVVDAHPHDHEASATNQDARADAGTHDAVADGAADDASDGGDSFDCGADVGVGTSADAGGAADGGPCVFTGCPEVLALGSPGDRFGAIAVDKDYVYWIDLITLWRCPIGGCGSAPTAFAHAMPRQSLVGLASNGDYVAWTDGLSVFECPVAGCGCHGPIVLALPEAVGSVYSIAMDATDVFWVSFSGGPKRHSTTGGGIQPLANVYGWPGIAVDDTYVYFAQFGRADASDQIDQVPKTGGPVVTPTEIAASGYTITTGGSQVLTVADAGVYWVASNVQTDESSDTSFLTCPYFQFGTDECTSYDIPVFGDDAPLWPQEVASNGHRVYATFASESDAGLPHADGGVTRGIVFSCDSSGCNGLILLPRGAYAVAADANNVYWSDFDDLNRPRIMKLPHG